MLCISAPAKETVFMTQNEVRVPSTGGRVQVTASGDDNVIVELDAGPEGVTMTGSRYDVHRLIIEADKQLSRLVRPWA